MIGVRGHYGYVLDGLPHLPHVQVVGVSAGDPADDIAPLKTWCDENAHPAKVFDDWRRMLDELSPQIVVVAGPFERIAEMCIEAFSRGAHVLSEKPVAMTLAELDSLAAAHSRGNVHFAAMMGLRYDPAFYTAWRAVKDGAVGEVRLIDTRKSYKLGRRDAFYCSRRTYPGTIPWVGSHAIDWIRWFTGQDFRTVFAAHSTGGNRGHGELEASALCQFTLTGDVLASVSIDYFRPETAPTHGDDRLRTVGTDGVIEVRDGKVWLINADGEQEVPAECGRQIFRDFVAHVEGGGEALITACDTLTVTEACLLARLSADERRSVAFGSQPAEGRNS